MKLIRMISGITVLSASAWMGPAISEFLGVSEVFGFVGFGAIVAVFGGILFYSGLTDKKKVIRCRCS